MPTYTYRFAKITLRILFHLGGGLEVVGQEKVPQDGPLVVAANHASYLDPMILGAAFHRDLHFMARKTLFQVPLFGTLIRWTQAFPLDREGDSREAIRAFGELLERDKAVVLFPEGTRTRDGRLGEVKAGVGMIAVRYRSPVTPVYIWGSWQGWPRGKRLPSRHRIKLVIGDAVRPSTDDKARRREEQERITREVGEAFLALEREAWRGEGEPPSAPRGPGRAPVPAAMTITGEESENA